MSKELYCQIQSAELKCYQLLLELTENYIRHENYCAHGQYLPLLHRFSIKKNKVEH